ncbi:MAG: trypsin-like serine protease [Myxococcota bacterium]
MRSLVVAFGLVASGAACGPGEWVQDGRGDGAVGRADAAIKDGFADADTTAVLGMVNVATGALCTGTLIGPNLVLTARHCVSSSSDGEGTVTCGVTTLGAPWSPAGFFLTTDATPNAANFGDIRVEAVIPLGGALAVPPHDDEDDFFCGNDLSALILRENIPAEEVAPVEPRLTPVAPGEMISAVGYGAVDGAGNDAGQRRRRDDIPVVCLGEACVGAGFSEGEVTPSEWVGGGGVCRGDSGGPALDADGRIVGVTSRGDLACDVSLYAGIPDYALWLKNVATLASGRGDYPAPGWAEGATIDRAWGFEVGADCTTGTDCPSGLCIPGSDDGPGYCSRPCEPAAPCPDEYRCDEDAGGDLGAACRLIPAVSNGTFTPAAPLRPDDDGGCRVSKSGIEASSSGRFGSRWPGVVFVMLALAGLRRRSHEAC